MDDDDDDNDEEAGASLPSLAAVVGSDDCSDASSLANAAAVVGAFDQYFLHLVRTSRASSGLPRALRACAILRYALGFS